VVEGGVTQPVPHTYAAHARSNTPAIAAERLCTLLPLVGLRRPSRRAVVAIVWVVGLRDCPTSRDVAPSANHGGDDDTAVAILRPQWTAGTPASSAAQSFAVAGRIGHVDSEQLDDRTDDKI
jgi:hypothetical protein